MADTIEILREKMERAALALDFEEAKRCRDQIEMLRGGATPDEAAEADFTGLERQKPGAMGLGTIQQRATPPPGWKRPAKLDPMTAGRSKRSPPPLMTTDARRMTMALLSSRLPGGTICPSEVARTLARNTDWRAAMPEVHATVDHLLDDGAIRLSWKGQPLTARAGPYRIALAEP